MSDGDLSLWRAVIAQAFADAEMNAESGSAPIDRAEARQWLTAPSADLDRVCALAGLDPEAVRAFAISKFGDHAEIEIPERRHTRGPAARLIHHNGLSLSLKEWAAHLGIHPSTIHQRMKRGWPIGKVLSEPAGATVPGKHRKPQPTQAAA